MSADGSPDSGSRVQPFAEDLEELGLHKHFLALVYFCKPTRGG